MCPAGCGCTSPRIDAVGEGTQPLAPKFVIRPDAGNGKLVLAHVAEGRLRVALTLDGLRAETEGVFRKRPRLGLADFLADLANGAEKGRMRAWSVAAFTLDGFYSSEAVAVLRAEVFRAVIRPGVRAWRAQAELVLGPAAIARLADEAARFEAEIST